MLAEIYVLMVSLSLLKRWIHLFCWIKRRLFSQSIGKDDNLFMRKRNLVYLSHSCAVEAELVWNWKKILTWKFIVFLSSLKFRFNQDFSTDSKWKNETSLYFKRNGKGTAVSFYFILQHFSQLHETLKLRLKQMLEHTSAGCQWVPHLVLLSPEIHWADAIAKFVVAPTALTCWHFRISAM